MYFRLRLSARTVGRRSEHRGIAKNQSCIGTHHALRTDENAGLDVACEIAKNASNDVGCVPGLERELSIRLGSTSLLRVAGGSRPGTSVSILGYPLRIPSRSKRLPSPSTETDDGIGFGVSDDDFPGEPTKLWLDRLSRVATTPIVAVDSSCVVPMSLWGGLTNELSRIEMQPRNCMRSEYRKIGPRSRNCHQAMKVRFPLNHCG